MKRVTLFICSLTSGGAEHQLTLLGHFLAEKGYKITLVTFGDSEDHYLMDSSVNRVRLAAGKSNFRKSLAIFKYFLTIDTDCIISFGARENFLALPALFLRPKIKFLAGERCATFEKLTTYKKINYAILYKRANFIVPNSYTQKDDISRIKPSYASKTVVITNFTDTHEYIVQEQPKNEIVRIGIFGRYSAQKNYVRFAQMLARLKKKTNVRFHVDWYGKQKTIDAPVNEYLHMVRLVEDYKIGDVITLNDQTREVAKLIPGFDVMCLPSLAEGFSNSISEYICCGKPVICSDVADNHIMVKEGENGFLFNPYNIDEMVDAFMKFFNLSTLEKEEMGSRSRQIAESLFDKEAFTKEYITLIES